MNTDPLKIFVNTPDCNFVMPYIRRRLPEAVFVDSPREADRCVTVAQDRSAVDCRPGGLGLHCPAIVGTGMNGKPWTLACAIAGGRLYHVAGNEARMSVIHATDVAEAVALALDDSGSYTLTDLANPTVTQLSEALSRRIDNRRIYTLKPFWAKMLMPRSLYTAVTTDAVSDGSEFAEKFNFKPSPVTTYLTTHVYDDESL